MRVRRAEKKADAGARFLQLQIATGRSCSSASSPACSGPGVTERCAILPSICILRSAKALRFVGEHVPGVEVPDEVIARAQAAEDQEHECFEIAYEQARHALTLPGVAGLHFISFRNDAGIAKLCERLGIPPRAEREQHGYRHPLTV